MEQATRRKGSYVKTKTVVIVASIAVAILVILGGFLLAKDTLLEPSYAVRISNGQKYIDSGDYGNAILEYQAAIEMNSTEEEGYIGLAHAYKALGFDSLANETVENGLREVGNSDALMNLREAEIPDPVETDADSESSDAKSTSENTLAVNAELLQFFATASYGDYQSVYEDLRTHMDGDTCVVETDSIDGVILFYDDASSRSINRSTLEPYPEILPKEIRLNSLATLFGGKDTISFQELQKLGGTTRVLQKDGTIELDLYGCTVMLTCDDSGAVRSAGSVLIAPSGDAVSYDDHVITGFIIDVTNGASVSGAELTFYQAGENDARYTVVSDGSGRYSQPVAESGSYTVVVSKSGYIRETFQVYVTDMSEETIKDFGISPELQEDEIRIVLTWGANPTDLDSHLTGYASDGTTLHVYFGAKQAFNSSFGVIADLDVDDVTSYGPETTTIHDVEGSFYFDVIDFTRSIGVGPSGAAVKIYKGNQLLYTVTPDRDVGINWRVCSIENGEVTILNERIADPDPSLPW